MAILGLKSSLPSFSSLDMSFLSNKSDFFHTDLGLPLFFRVFVVDLLQRVLSSTCCGVFCRQPLVAGSVSSTISFFVGFRVDSSNSKVRFDSP